MPLVVDASFAAAWFLPDEASAATDAVARSLVSNRALAPGLFWHELRNLLLTAHRRGRLTSVGLFEQLARAERFPLMDCGAGDAARIVALAQSHNLTAYDAAYLALALQERASLATLDRALAAAAEREGLALLGPLAK